mmetsp:Transcript_87599/g.252955  ORF Transcript_87599/g.252955 Transcript_87599/m.252955 type:complete len:710 (+) Transcript_87599:53-2182(+)
MVAWETQIEERSVPAWRDKYVRYAKLKRMLEQLEVPKNKEVELVETMQRALSEDSANDHGKAKGLKVELLEEQEQKRQEFMDAVYAELRRVSAWYDDEATALEARVRAATSATGDTAGGAAALKPAGEHAAEDIEHLHLEAAQLTEYVLLNVEGLRKIVKKMDKTCGTNEQKKFVECHLKRSAFASNSNSKNPYGQRAKDCRKALEECLSPERIQELRSKALSLRHGAKAAKLGLRRRRAVVCAGIAVLAALGSASSLPDNPRAQRCVGLVAFIVSMWLSEAAPFEGTALFVPPLAVLLDLVPGTKREQAKKVLASVFTDSLYLVLCGFVISSVFTKCQLEARTAALLQRRLGRRPFLFVLAVMFLGLFLSALLSNVTAPLLLIEVLKPLLRDLPTDSRYSRIVLLGLAFSCNIGGMVTPISSPQNIAALTILEQHDGRITWGQWLSVSVPFCSLAVVMAWAVLLVVHHFDVSSEERARIASGDAQVVSLPSVTFEAEAIDRVKLMSLASACATLVAFACRPISDVFGGTAVVAVFYIAIALACGMVTRQTFNSYSWHLLFLIGGGSALGFVVSESGLLATMSRDAREGLAAEPSALIAELVLVLVGATTFVSHTVAALVFMPLVVKLGASAGVQNLAVFICGLACSVACALPMTSFPNVNSLMAVDDAGKTWLRMQHFLKAGAPTTLLLTLLLVTFGISLASQVISDT